MGIWTPSLLLPPWQRNLMRKAAAGPLLRTSLGDLAGAVACCCTPEYNDCERYRGVRDSGDVHAHDSSVFVEMLGWDPRGADHFEIDVDDECCESLNDVYELPIRDYDTVAGGTSGYEWCYFGNLPGMFMPTCIPCHDCFEEFDEEAPDLSWSILRAFCGECDYDFTPACRSRTPTASYDMIWTVELEVWGYWNTVCNTGDAFCDEPGGVAKARMVWAKKLLSSAAPHNYAGLHTLSLVEHTGPTYATFPSLVTFADLYCTPPGTITLYASYDPPP
jgi:hypothetical protein